jgi:signal transduction histidine kinase
VAWTASQPEGKGSNTPTGGAYVEEASVEISAVIEEVLVKLRHRLESGHSALLLDPTTAGELERQVTYVLEDVLGRTGSAAPGSMTPTGVARLFSVEVGATRAQRGVHPIESLRAATELFGVALPIIAAYYAEAAQVPVLATSLALHEAIMDRVGLASLSYVDLLLEKLRASRQEERRRIARELHDRVGHGMALALQHIDLSQYYAEQDCATGGGSAGKNAAVVRNEIGVAVSALTEAMHTVQLLAAELRRSVGTVGIESGLRAYLTSNVPAGIRADLRVAGDVKALPPNVSEELYLIMREAVRNAVRHGAPTDLRLLVEVSEDLVTASVTDDGVGFDPSGYGANTGGGLPSMFERAELLRGVLELTSEIGTGSRVEVRVPLGASGL